MRYGSGWSVLLGTLCVDSTDPFSQKEVGAGRCYILGFFSEKTQYRWSVPCVSMQLTLSLCRFK